MAFICDTMDEEQVRVLQRHTRDIVDGIHMEEKLLCAFMEKDVFTPSMVEIIRSKSTQSDQLYEMLCLLRKRGPEAFNQFIEIIGEDYNWLAQKLQKNYKEEILKRHTETESCQTEKTEKAEDKEPTISTTTPLDAPDMETQTRQTRLNYLIPSKASVSQQGCLNRLYTKVKTQNDICMYRRGNTEISMTTPEPATFKMVETELDDLFQRMTELEDVLKQVYGILGLTTNSTSDPITHLLDLQRGKKELEKQVRAKDQQKNRYCDKINKLESASRDQTSKMEQMEKEVEKLHQSVADAEKESGEKQETIDSLKKMLSDMECKQTTRRGQTRNPVVHQSQHLELKKLQEEIKGLRKENASLKCALTESHEQADLENLKLVHSNIENLRKLVKVKEEGNFKDNLQQLQKLTKSSGETTQFVSRGVTGSTDDRRLESQGYILATESGGLKQQKRKRDTSLSRLRPMASTVRNGVSVTDSFNNRRGTRLSMPQRILRSQQR